MSPQFEPSHCSGHQTCPNEQIAANALRHFYDVVGGEIHALDPDHLVEAGLIGNGQCGTAGQDYAYVGSSPGIDVLSYHDYSVAKTPIPGDRWNGLAVRFAQAAAIGKPVVGGEEGIDAGRGCRSDRRRASLLSAHIKGQIAKGSSGVLLWNWVPGLDPGCTYDIAPHDPLLRAITTLPIDRAGPLRLRHHPALN